MGVQVPVFGALNFLYAHRPATDPAAVNYDVRIYFDAASAVLEGQLPYRDFFFQYPPLSVLSFIPPRFFAADLSGYFAWFNVELLILACIGVMATGVITRLTGQQPMPAFLFYTLGLLAFGAIIPQRYDLVPAILVLIALAAWLDGRHGVAYALLALGTMTKIYPALLAPVFAISEWRTLGVRRVVRGLSIFAGLILLVMLPFVFLSPQEALSAFGNQAGRGMGITSTYASLMLFARPLGIPAEIVYQQTLNSWNVVLGHSDWPALAATVLQLVSIMAVYVGYVRSRDTSDSALVRYATAAIGIGILTSKVLSAQYVIWLFPLPFLTGGRRLIPISVAFLACAAMTQLLFPFLWNDLKLGTTTALLVALARDVCLGALCYMLLAPPPAFLRTSTGSTASVTSGG